MKTNTQTREQSTNQQQKPIPSQKYQSILSKQNSYLLSLFSHKINKLPSQTLYQSYSHQTKSHYLGQFKLKNGKRLKHGLGQMTWPAGGVYIGEWANGQRQGNGIEIDQEGNRYEGEYGDGERNGFGIEKMVNGDRYEGEWKCNKKHGKGKEICALMKQTYQGYFQQGKRHGKGKVIYRSGDLFQGYWQHGLKDGNGIVIFYNGDVFKGQWIHNLSQGRCSIHYKTGDYFIGQYENGNRKGLGTYIFATRQKIEGQWEGDHDCIGKLFYTNGEIYEGQLLKGQRHGWGKYLYQNGDIYQGQWVNGEKAGFGQYFSGAKKQFSGIWSHDNQLYGQYQNLTQKQPGCMLKTQITIKGHLKKPFGNIKNCDDFSTPKATKGKYQYFQSNYSTAK